VTVLAVGGVAGIQAITIQERFFLNYRREIDYIRRYVFPGGMLPSPAILKSLGVRSAFRWCAREGVRRRLRAHALGVA
jgi:cyclopropane fatty-acyl-phospholipid synthase-like methyltransferase